MCYRWEIGPLSDLFLVIRGQQPGRVDDSFDDLFDDALREPVIDVFVEAAISLLYRSFGNSNAIFASFTKRDRDQGLSVS